MRLSSCLVLLIVVSYCSGSEPILDSSTIHVTASEGTDVILPCSITSLGRHKVGWFGPNSLVLTIESRRVVDDVRFSVTRKSLDDWDLQISRTQLHDSGSYKCTINTTPIRSKTVVLTVEAPPSIKEAEEGEGKKVVEEGGNVTLSCETTGIPTPHVTWIRVSSNAGSVDEVKEKVCRYKTADGRSRRLTQHDNHIEESLGSGESMTIVGISRHCGGEYKCVATNNHPPDPQRSFTVDVEFAPEVTLQNTRLWQLLGKETVLECNVQASPYGVIYWEKAGVKLTNSEKYQIEAYDEVRGLFALTLNLRISEKSDFGEYVCMAANVHGSGEAGVQLLEYIQPTTEAVIVHHVPSTRASLAGNSQHDTSVEANHREDPSDSYSLGYKEERAGEGYKYHYEIAGSGSLNIPCKIVLGLAFSIIVFFLR